MKIKINKDAANIYKRSCYRGSHPACGMAHSQSYYEALKKVEGQILDVETKHLFSDQFNTETLRIMANVVDEVIDDERIGKYKSGWDGKMYDTLPSDIEEDKKEYLFQYVKHPNKMVREDGVHVYKLYVNDEKEVAKYNMYLRGAGFPPYSINKEDNKMLAITNEHIHDSVKRALVEANTLKRTIILAFNGIEITVYETSNRIDLLKIYCLKHRLKYRGAEVKPRQL